MTDKLLIKKRSSMKAKLTHFNNHLQLLLSSECLSKLQRRDLESRFDKFIRIYDEFDYLQTEIKIHSDNLEEAYEARAQFEEQYHSQIAQAQTLLADNPDEDIKRDSGEFVTGSEDGPALVRVVSSNGEKHTARMLLDNGSTSNFITESLCDKLNLPRSSASSMVTGINNLITEDTYQLVNDLALPKDVQQVPYEEVIKLLDGHFTPRQVSFSERHSFYAAEQTAHCKFTNVEETLRDRFVMAMLLGPEKEMLFVQELSGLTLAKAVELAP
ncbi:uncharacterized protein LOC121725479 [Aricia agestis]|uniref:uncharacterized protein LOC121725479 n=1 Tax=Aricia agestis TaxID=91739 RepID=UPI001C208195|nr:uncharacterized protein LOC121725479 [Aricia agestis]